MDEEYNAFISVIIDEKFADYCKTSINRPELVEVIKFQLIDKTQAINRIYLLFTALTGSVEETEKVLQQILVDVPRGCIAKLALILGKEKHRIQYSFSDSFVKANICLKFFEHIHSCKELESLATAFVLGELKPDEFFRLAANLVHENRIDLTQYHEITQKILLLTGHTSNISSSKSSCDDIQSFSQQSAISIANASVYFVHSMVSNSEDSISIYSRVEEGFQLLSANRLGDSPIKIDMKLYREIRPVTSLNNIFWLHFLSETSHTPPSHDQGFKLVKLNDGENLVIIHSLQKTANSVLEIDRILCVDGYYLSNSPLSLQLAVVLEGHCYGSEEGALSDDLNEATSEIAKNEVHNNSPNASGQDGSNNIIPDYSLKTETFLLNIICTEQYSILLSVATLSDDLLADQKIIGIKLRRDNSYLYGTHGLCAVHQFNKNLPRFHCTSLLVPDTTRFDDKPAENENIFHSQSSIVAAIDIADNETILASGDNHGKICVWKQNSRKFSSSRQNIPSFSICNWYNDNHHHCDDPQKYDPGVHMLRISPSREFIIAGIGGQLILLRRNSQAHTFQDSNAQQLSIVALLDTQKYCQTIYDASFSSLGVITIWRLTSSYEIHANESRNFATLSVWKQVDPSFQYVSSTAQEHYDSRTLNSLHPSQMQVAYSDYQDSNSKVISRVAEIGGETIPISEVLHISIHPCARVLVARCTTSIEDLSGQKCRDPSINYASHLSYLNILSSLFSRKRNLWMQFVPIFAILAASFQPATIAMLGTALEISREEVLRLLTKLLRPIFRIEVSEDHQEIVHIEYQYQGILKWMTSTTPDRVRGQQIFFFWVDIAIGHNLLCAMYLRYCGNKSIAVEHPWQTYLQTYGPYHLRRSSRGLRCLTLHIRKIDETANIKQYLPHQIGYVSGLQEIYARRVGLSGKIPKEIGELRELRVLSMGNNRLTGRLPESLGNLTHLQRIVLHQNNLIGEVPAILGEMGCIVNLAGNPRLEYGADVPISEREALIELFYKTNGHRWTNRTNWITGKPVSKWYKVGVLSSHVHSLVMSSNNMDGSIPTAINRLNHLRMIELATMPHLIGPLPPELCQITTLRRLCICRCGLTGSLPEEIGLLVHLEELQLFGNRLTGKIPMSIGNLLNLKLLSLGEYTGGNDFSPGFFPPCIERLKNLEALFLADCRVKGPLPMWIGNLTELRQLDLQRNQLSGPMPASIGRLRNLLYFNIKDNPNLGGRLPVQELANLARLNRLSLVHCGFDDRETALNALRNALPRCKIWI